MASQLITEKTPTPVAKISKFTNYLITLFLLINKYVLQDLFQITEKILL